MWLFLWGHTPKGTKLPAKELRWRRPSPEEADMSIIAIALQVRRARQRRRCALDAGRVSPGYVKGSVLAGRITNG